jgi:2-keto-3-deoxy-L-rhamnonate aldolase RhmA
LTVDAKLARYADRAGVDRVGVDLEIIGKAERQGGLGTWISDHREDQIPAIADQLSQASLFARTNPLHRDSVNDVAHLLDMGVEVLMVPMFTTAREVEKYIGLVKGRAKVVPLLETVPAAERVEEIVALDGIDEIHVGINDLGLGLGFRNRFLTLTTDLIVRVVDSILEAGIRLALGSIGRALDDSLPLPSELVYAQYARLGATAAFVSQQFLSDDMTESQFRMEVEKIRERMTYWSRRDSGELKDAYRRFRTILENLTGTITNKATTPNRVNPQSPHDRGRD